MCGMYIQKYKSVLCLDLAHIPKIAHHEYANISKYPKSKTWNTSSLSILDKGYSLCTCKGTGRRIDSLFLFFPGMNLKLQIFASQDSTRETEMTLSASNNQTWVEEIGHGDERTEKPKMMMRWPGNNRHP